MATKRNLRNRTFTPSQEDIAADYVRKNEDREGSFSVVQIKGKGRGVVAIRKFDKGEFLLQYTGEILSEAEGLLREDKHETGYRFFFTVRGTCVCVDASEEPGEKGPWRGRLVNHGEKNEVNTIVKPIEVDGTPSLVLFALKEINIADEILYDYGPFNQPWKREKQKQKPFKSMKDHQLDAALKQREDIMAAIKIQRAEQNHSEMDVLTETAQHQVEKESRITTVKEKDITKCPNVDDNNDALPYIEREEEEEDCDVGELHPILPQDLERAPVALDNEELNLELYKSLYVEKSNGRWAEDVIKLRNGIRIREVDSHLLYSKHCKIADGSEGAQIFVGLLDGLPVAVKRCNIESKSTEWGILKALKSTSCILPLLYHKEDEDFSYTVLPLCEYNLQEVVENKDCPLRKDLDNKKRKQLCLDFLHGLKELHDAGIIHRDLKPANLLIDPTGKVLVADFGVSRDLFGKTTIVTTAMGTLCWMASEVYGTGDIRVKYKKSSDIQVAGFLCYYLLSDGHLPHEKSTPFSQDPMGLMKNKQDGCYSFEHLCDHDLARIIERMINVDPKRRPDIQDCIQAFKDQTASVVTQLDQDACNIKVCEGNDGQDKHAEEGQNKQGQDGQYKQGQDGQEGQDGLDEHDRQKGTNGQDKQDGEKGLNEHGEGGHKVQDLQVGQFRQVNDPEKSDGHDRQKGTNEQDKQAGEKGLNEHGEGGHKVQDLQVGQLRQVNDPEDREELESGSGKESAEDESESKDKEYESDSISGLESKDEDESDSGSGEESAHEESESEDNEHESDRISGLESKEEELESKDKEYESDSISGLESKDEDESDSGSGEESAHDESESEDNEHESDRISGLESKEEELESKDKEYESDSISGLESKDEDESDSGSGEESAHDESESEDNEHESDRISGLESKEEESESKESEDEDDDDESNSGSKEEVGGQEYEFDSDATWKESVNDESVSDEQKLEENGGSCSDMDEYHSGQEEGMDRLLKESRCDTSADEDNESDSGNKENDIGGQESDSNATSNESEKEENESEGQDAKENEDRSGKQESDMTCKRLKNGGSKKRKADEDGPKIRFVVRSKRKKDGSRRWDNYDYCLFCHTPQTNIYRHLKRWHNHEREVGEAMALGEDSAPPRWTFLKNEGNHQHNLLVDDSDEEPTDFMVVKRPRSNEIYDTDDFLPCDHCHGYYTTNALWAHAEKCLIRKEKGKPPRQKGSTKKTFSPHIKKGRQLRYKNKYVDAFFMSKVVNEMNNDRITDIVRKDTDILIVGQNNWDGSKAFKKKAVSRERMRLLAKVLRQAKSQDQKIKHAEDLVRPSSFDAVVAATRHLSGYDNKTCTHQRYSFALKVSYAMKNLAAAVRSRCLKTGGCLRSRADGVDDFLKIWDAEWRTKITSSAIGQRDDNKWKSPQILPTTEDCIKFINYLRKAEEAIKAEVAKANGLSDATYRRLAEVTLVQVIMYNRRRPTETSRLEVQHYLKQLEKKEISSEVMDSFTLSEKIAIKRLTVIMVRGKNRRPVPLLLTPNSRESMDMLVKFHKKNKSASEYIFARSSSPKLVSTTPLRGYVLMKALAKKADLKHPENMRCTKLRKHLATLSQLLGLTKVELEQLAMHMGHDINIHREYYRLPQEALLLAKMSKLLDICAKGQMHNHAGKSLNDIQLQPDEVFEESIDSGRGGDQEVEESPVSIAGVRSDEEQEEKDEQHEETQKKRTRRKNAGCRKYIRWTDDQNDFLCDQPEIKKHLENLTVPNKGLGLLLIKRAGKLLADKSWEDVKQKIHNRNNDKRRKMKKIQNKKEKTDRKARKAARKGKKPTSDRKARKAAKKGKKPTSESK